MRRLAACLVLAGACQRAAPERSSPAPALSNSAALRASAPPVTSVSPRVPAALAPLEKARALVSAWDSALNRHDADALGALYAPKVRFYGRSTSREQLIVAKQKALSATPDYVQALSQLRFVAESDGGVLVDFEKSSGPRNSQKSVRARLRLETNGDSYAIALESDAPSDALADANRSCESLAFEIVSRQPALVRLYREAPADARPGGLTYESRADYVSGTMGFHHDDRFESVFPYEVENGTLVIHGYDGPLPIAGEDQARIRAKCHK